MSRLDVPNFYYEQEDILIEESNKKHGLSWSVHRPQLKFGFSPFSMLNVVPTTCVYAVICKHLGVPLKFLGTKGVWEAYCVVSDVDLVVEQQIWATVDPNARNDRTR